MSQTATAPAPGPARRSYTAEDLKIIFRLPSADEAYRLDDVPGRYKAGRRTRWDADMVDGYIDEQTGRE
jgi:hypothetical protein